MDNETKQLLEDMQRQIDDLKSEGVIRDLSFEQQDSIREVVGDNLIDLTWNKIFYVSSFAAASVTTSSSTEDISAKEVDTSEGKYFDPKLPSRLRMNFYINEGQANATVYILSPTVNGVDFATAVPLSTSTTLSYVGVKIVKTAFKLVSYDRNTGIETLIDTEKVIDDNTTHTLELIYRPGESSDVYLDTDFVGSIESNLVDNAVIKVYYPYLTSVKSDSGSVNLTIENYEFIQQRFLKEKR